MNKFELLKKTEDKYIEDLKGRIGEISNDTEIKLRFAFSDGFMAAFDIARASGYEDAINSVRDSLVLPRIPQDCFIREA